MEKYVILHSAFRFYYRSDDGFHFKDMEVEERWPIGIDLNDMKRKLWLIATRDAVEYCSYNNVEFVRIETA